MRHTGAGLVLAGLAAVLAAPRVEADDRIGVVDVLGTEGVGERVVVPPGLAGSDLLAWLKATFQPRAYLGREAADAAFQGKPPAVPGVYGDYRFARELMFGYVENEPADDVVAVFLADAFFHGGEQTPLTGRVVARGPQGLRLESLDGRHRLAIPRGTVASEARAGRVTLAYSGDVVYYPVFGQEAGQRPLSCVPSANGPAGVNCEHVWPKSRFHPEREGKPKTDLHNLLPTYTLVNADRRRLAFGEVEDARTQRWWLGHTSSQGPDPASCPDDYNEALWLDDRGSEGLFEPRTAAKGNVARIILYVFGVYHRSGPEDLERDPKYPQLDEPWFYAQLPDLLRWHEADPVDATERTRNARIARVQGNRNPFIDDPGLARRVVAAIRPRIEDPALRERIDAALAARPPVPGFASPGGLGE